MARMQDRRSTLNLDAVSLLEHVVVIKSRGGYVNKLLRLTNIPAEI